MRLLGAAERGMDLMVKRATQRKAFGKSLAQQGTFAHMLAKVCSCSLLHSLNEHFLALEFMVIFFAHPDLQMISGNMVRFHQSRYLLHIFCSLC